MNEEGFESSIVQYLVNDNGYEQGSNDTYNRHYCLDENILFRFIDETQPKVYASLNLDEEAERARFMQRVSDQISKRGIVDVLRNGLGYYPDRVDLFYLLPDQRNPNSIDDYSKNIFSVTRQLRYSEINQGLELDLVIFINGIPVFTIELKNEITGQNFNNAIKQYCNDRSPKDNLLSFKRCLAHFAVDDSEVWFTTKLEGKNTYFMPFNKGKNGGAGNPVNPDGVRTDYFWKEILSKETLTNIIQNYVQVITIKNNSQKSDIQIFPRYHQLRVVEKLLDDVKTNGLGQKYLIQHSAGSGKSNSITWLAYQLVGAQKNGRSLFDSVIVVTDRKNLDRQLINNLKNFMEVTSNLAHAHSASELGDLLKRGKKIIVTTVQKFPYLLDLIGRDLNSRNFAIIIDEAHSSQSGTSAASMNAALSGNVDKNSDKDFEDVINDLIEGKKMLKNASYFAFTATPKSKTLEMFGTSDPTFPDKKIPFDNYSMKQAIEEGFILDVLDHYTSVKSYYKVAKIIEENPEFDAARSKKKIRKYVEGHEFALREKAQIIVEHFHDCTYKKLEGKARAMVVTANIERALDYYYLISEALEAMNSPYKPIIAFSGSKEYKGKLVQESTINGFPSNETPSKFKEDPYRFLIVADKYQTGYDEPLLHTMYVDKVLSDVKAVQTLSRLNRCLYGKNDTCVIDFANNPEDIQKSFSRFYKVTELEGFTDPNKLYDLLYCINNHQIFNDEIVDIVCEHFIKEEDIGYIHTILDSCVDRYMDLDEDDQIEFKSSAKTFVKAYNFLSSILPVGKPEWEKVTIFLTLLLPKLPTPKGEDLSKGVLDAISLDSYRAEKQKEIRIQLDEESGEIKPSTFGINQIKEVEKDPLDKIVSDFNSIFGDIQWSNADNIAKQIEELPNIIAQNEIVMNAIKNSTEQNARLEFDNALLSILTAMINDHMELFKQYNQNEIFKKWLSDSVFEIIYNGKIDHTEE